MKSREILYRRAAPNEAEAVAAIARTSRAHFLPYLPDLHSLEEAQAFFRNVVFQDCEVWVAEDPNAPAGQTLLGFCAYRDNWVDHLYLRPEHVGRSHGQALLNKAMERQNHLQLWVFQKNTKAIRFYKSNGFQLVRKTDGSTNEEKVPDALYAWRK